MRIFLFFLLFISCNSNQYNEKKVEFFLKDYHDKSYQYDSIGMIKFYKYSEIDFYYVNIDNAPSKTDFRICYFNSVFFLNDELSDLNKIIKKINKSSIESKQKKYLTVWLSYGLSKGDDELVKLFYAVNNLYSLSTKRNEIIFCLNKLKKLDCLMSPPPPLPLKSSLHDSVYLQSVPIK